MSFDVNIKGSDNLPIPTTADPETHGDRIAAKAEYDAVVRDIVQDAVDAIGKLDATSTVVATGTVGEIGPISLVHAVSCCGSPGGAGRGARGRDLEEVVPLELTKRDAKRLTRNRRLLQPPAPGQPLLSALTWQRVEGIPLDVLFTLESLRQLGEQGNQIAMRIYEMERDRLGIDRPRTL